MTRRSIIYGAPGRLSFRARFDPPDRAVVSSIDHVELPALHVLEHQGIGVPQVEHHHSVRYRRFGNINPGFGNDCRAFRRLVGRSWTDAIRTLHPDERVYTFWHYMRKRWERDAGLRLDHLLLSPNLAGRLAEVGVDRDVRGVEGASDHAPAWIRLRAASRPGE